MLVLTRKLEEKIQIGPNITLTIVRIKGHSVQIGIEAPDQVRVLRGELAAAEDLCAEGSEPLGDARSDLPKPGRTAGHGPIDFQDLGRRALRCFLPPHESCPSGAGDFVHQAQAVSVGEISGLWR